MKAEAADIALLARVLNGDETGLAALLDRHWHSLVRYSRSILEDSDAAKDVVQQVFVRFWEHRETRGLTGSVLGLLFRMTRNMSLDDYRRRDARQRVVDNAASPEQPAGPVEHVQNDEIGSVLQAALAQLPQRRREVFVLVREYGLSYIETAEALGIAPETVADDLSMALSHLKEALTPVFSNQLHGPAWRDTNAPRSCLV
jgi:RNA polymerase sigma-70 factor (ECF subfamily)